MRALTTYSFKVPEDIDCHKLPRATVHVRLKYTNNQSIENKLCECYSEGLPGRFHPRVVMGGAPYQAMRGLLTSKGSFSRMMSAFRGKHETIHPQTFELLDPVQCKMFFGMAQGNLRNPGTWMLKYVDGSWGRNIMFVTNFSEQLVMPYGECKVVPTARRYVVQQYIIPHLINERKYGVRVFLLYKFRGGDAHRPDPEQSWLIKEGEVNLCSEPFSSSSDTKLRAFATNCNLHISALHPNYGKPGMEGADFEKVFLPFMKEQLSDRQFDKLVGRFDTAMGTLSDVITAYAEEKGIRGSREESNWVFLACDFQVDKDLKPWLLEVNSCPEYPGTETYASMLRVMLTHYRRHFLKDDNYSEHKCGNDTAAYQLSVIRFPDE